MYTINFLKKKFSLFLIILISFFVVFAQAEVSWKNIFEKDLQAIYDELKENHPGFYDYKNPAFKKWLEQGYQRALEKSDNIDSLVDYIYGLRFFVNGFQDGHLRISFDKSSFAAEWPGFCIGYQQGKCIIVASENDAIPVGAEVVACDGELPTLWLEKNVMPYIDARSLETSLFAAAPYLTLWEGSVFGPKPKQYVFKIDNITQEVTPIWQKVGVVSYFSKFPKRNGPSCASIKDIRVNQAWVSIPSFNPQSEQEKDALDTVVTTIAHYSTYDLIIFDLRGNGGGNSYYGSMMLKNLYGKEYYNTALKTVNDKKYVEWRASQANIDYLKELIKKFEQQFGQAEIVSVFSDIQVGMQKSQLAGNSFYKAVDGSGSDEIKEMPAVSKSLNARIVIITDNYCASACLNFLDELFTLDSVIHVGIATNADTDYMECRTIKLPSALVTLHIPIKVFRNRIRKANEAYVPQYHVDDIYNNHVIEEVIEKLVLS